MNQALKISLCACLTVASVWGGRSLAVRERREPRREASVNATPRLVEKAHPPIAQTVEEAEALRAAAHCTTAALWELLEADDALPDGDQRTAVLRELLDREGRAAVLHAEGLADENLRWRLTHDLLRVLAKGKPMEALELYKTLSEEAQKFNMGTISALCAGAAADSAESMIAVMDALKWNSWGLADYAADFDFRKVAEHALAGDTAGPYAMASAWGRQSPLAALDWLRSHPNYNEYGGGDVPVDTLGQVFSEIVKSASPEREEALLRIAQYYPDAEERDQIWSGMLSGPESIDPGLARIADSMGSQQAYLVACLQEGLNVEEQAPAWAQIPAEQRDAAVAEVLKTWQESDPSPNGDKARAHWQASFDKACGK